MSDERAEQTPETMTEAVPAGGVMVNTGQFTGLPNDKEELADRIHAFLLKLLQLPQHVMSYFQHPCVLYAAAQEV